MICKSVNVLSVTMHFVDGRVVWWIMAWRYRYSSTFIKSFLRIEHNRLSAVWICLLPHSRNRRLSREHVVCFNHYLILIHINFLLNMSLNLLFVRRPYKLAFSVDFNTFFKTKWSYAPQRVPKWVLLVRIGNCVRTTSEEERYYEYYTSNDEEANYQCENPQKIYFICFYLSCCQVNEDAEADLEEELVNKAETEV